MIGNSTDKKEFTDWLKHFRSIRPEEISNWVDKAKVVCLDHFTHSSVSQRKKQSVYFRIALSGVIKLKFEEITQSQIAIELTRTLKLGKSLDHSVIIYYFKILKKSEDIKNGYADFLHSYNSYLSDLNKKGLL